MKDKKDGTGSEKQIPLAEGEHANHLARLRESIWLKEIGGQPDGLYDDQVLNLKLWPYILFRGLKTHQFYWKDHVVHYTFTGIQDPEDNKNVETLSDSVKFLLGSVWSVDISWSGSGKGKKNDKRDSAKKPRPHRTPKSKGKSCPSAVTKD